MAPFEAENGGPLLPVQPRPLNVNQQQKPLVGQLNGQGIDPFYGGNDCAEQKVENTLMSTTSALNSPHDQKINNSRSSIYPFFEQPHAQVCIETGNIM